MSVGRSSLPGCVVLVDAENVSPDALDSLMRWLRVRFNIVKAIGFADFSQRALIGADSALRQQGITPQHVPSQRSGRSYRKNLVDPTLIVEMMMTANPKAAPFILHLPFVLNTGYAFRVITLISTLTSFTFSCRRVQHQPNQNKHIG